MFSEDFDLVTSKYPKVPNLHFVFGTSGFRYNENFMDSIVYRMGMLASLRSKLLNGLAVGLMITASHNPSEYNGIKLIDHNGDMVNHEWETLSTQFINSEDDKVKSFILNLCSQDSPSLVLLARDNRNSSLRLSQAAIDGVKSLKGSFKDFELLTTPQMHLIVKSYNYGGMEPTEHGYYKKISDAFNSLYSLTSDNHGNYNPNLFLDCANGVGGTKMINLKTYLLDIVINLYNTGDGIINKDCGSDYVMLKNVPPINCEIKPNQRWATFDGDADRIIYFYIKEENIKVINGDKIAILFTLYIKELLNNSVTIPSSLDMTIVQTAYSNSVSTQFIKNLGITVHIVPTGIKNLVNQGKKSDISIIFESNGHGLIHFSDKAIETFKSGAMNGDNSSKILLMISNLVNQTTGDAISDLLIVEFILKIKGWSIEDWDQLYEEVPSYQTTVVVRDRNFITTNENQTKCLAPKGLQESIDKLCMNYQNSRAFVRSSGTEDIVRIYAESNTSDCARELALKVKEAVVEYSKV